MSTHEIAEVVTDPDVDYKSLSWYDDTLNGEIGDLTSDTATLSGYLVQKVVDKNDSIIGPSTAPAPTPSPVVNSLKVSPTSITVGAATAVVLTANATDSTAATITGVKFYTSSGTPLGSGVASGSNWSLAIAGTSSLAVSNYVYYAVATDSAGVSTPAGTSATSVVLAVTADAPANDTFANASVVAGTPFSVIGTNVNAGGSVLTSAVTFNAVAGTSYRFVVDGSSAASGSISLGLTMTTAAASASSPPKGEASSNYDRYSFGSPSGCPKSEAFAALAQAASSDTRPQARPFRFR